MSSADADYVHRACDALYHWPAGDGWVVGGLHLHNDDGCRDGVLSAREEDEIEIEVPSMP